MLGTIVPSIIDSSLYIPDLKVRRKSSVLHEMVERAHLAGAVRWPDPLRELLAVREALGVTAPGRGVAVPGVRSLVVTECRIVIARSRRGIDWGAADGLPVHLVFLALSPADCPEGSHLELIARIVAAVRPQRSRQKMLEATDFGPIAAALRDLVP
jgi:mannitol/fructose-specific phosphotransferase system IIA component (Ntr-type)